MARDLIPWAKFDWPLSRLRNEMDNLIERFFGSEVAPAWSAMEGPSPRMDVAESDKAFEVTLDLPGMKPEDFRVEMSNGHLCISGEKKEEKEEKGKTYHRLERRYGAFQRVVPLGSEVDKDKIEAKYKEGVLQITVPKTAAAQPHQIKVKT